ncbi:MAG: transposase [Prevotella sp.]|nr:transposase [Prevotella sp.]
MAKVQHISGISKRIPFDGFDFYDLFRITFENSELGRMKRLLPLHEMAVNFGLVPKKQGHRRGPKSYFSAEGKVALMFLKMYTGLSAPKLMEQLNGNVHYQLFCDISLNPLRPLTNYKLIDDIAMELAGKLKIQQQQDILAEIWKPYMKDLDTFYTDATCYESDMRYPTDQKLLWECIEKSYRMMCELSQRLGLRRPRTKYLDVEKANMGYVKQRKHSKSQQRKLTRRLIHLLGKILEEIRKMMREHDGEEGLTVREQSTIDIITKVYRQQKNHFNGNDPRESIPERIVSVSKPYVRPIVRGKEVKNVEFGAKCNNIQVDGISFIEKLSFNAFSEGTRLEHCIKMHKRLFKTDVKKIGGDTGYAGSSNRNLCKQMGIQTSFVKRGRPSTEKTEKDFVRQELARVRATAMEGSFGTQKEHYDLRRIKARTKKTEILYIFFGIHTANAVHMAERLAEQERAKAA